MPSLRHVLPIALLSCPPSLALAADPLLEPPAHPFLTFEHPQDWTLSATLFVFGKPDCDVVAWRLDQASVAFPIMSKTAGARADTSRATAELEFEQRLFDDTPTFLEGDRAGADLLRLDANDVSASKFMLNVKHRVVAWRTKFDESRLDDLNWPTQPWPDEAAAYLTPQPFIDPVNTDPTAHEAINRLVARWTNGADPRSVRPIDLAKWFAAQTVNEFQPSGTAQVGNEFGLEGFELQTLAKTINTRRGTDFDVANVLTAAYRRAGLPARLVIAYVEPEDEPRRRRLLPTENRPVEEIAEKDADVIYKYDLNHGKRDEAGNPLPPKMLTVHIAFSETRKESHNLVAAGGGAQHLHPYVEFYLYDEYTQVGGWIPVDVAMMRDKSSRAPTDLNASWRYFGNHDELDRYVPVSIGYGPPPGTTHVARPAFWGWTQKPTPTLPVRMIDLLMLSADRTPSNSPLRPRDTPR